MDLAMGFARARRVEPGDDLSELLPEYVSFQITNPELIWVVENGWDRICAVLLATYGNQIAVLIRLAASSEAPHGWLVTLLRQVANDLEEMGAKAVLVSLSVDRLPELKMAKLIQRAGGNLQPVAGFIAAFGMPHMRKL